MSKLIRIVFWIIVAAAGIWYVGTMIVIPQKYDSSRCTTEEQPCENN